MSNARTNTTFSDLTGPSLSAGQEQRLAEEEREVMAGRLRVLLPLMALLNFGHCMHLVGRGDLARPRFSEVHLAQP